LGTRSQRAPWLSPAPRSASGRRRPGPVVLAGLTDEERVTPSATLPRPDRESQHSWWNAGTYRAAAIRFRPLYGIIDERYTVYFPVRSD